MRRVTLALAAAFAMTIAITATTSARTFSFTNRNFKVVWTSLELSGDAGVGTIRCPVTLEGSFHSSTMSKVEKALIGHISRAAVAEASCTGGTVTVRQESLPWHVTYNGFRGILPRINSIRILLLGPSFRIRSPFLGSTCNATNDSTHEARGEGIIEEAALTNDLPDGTVNIPLTGCEATVGNYRGGAGDGRITLLGTTTRIRVTLI
jgi:hypothetical protein